MSATGDLNIVIAQAHMVSKSRHPGKEKFKLQQQLAGQVETKKQQKKKAQVESSAAGNRIQVRHDEAKKEKQSSEREKNAAEMQKAENNKTTGPRAGGSYVDIKV